NMAPEQAKSAAGADGRSDLYSLGVSAFEMLTGRLPFTAPNAFELLLKHHSDPVPTASLLAPDLPVAIDGFFQIALAKEPDGRFQSAADFKAALQAAATAP